ncbi:MAG TPA: ABC transporter permease [Acidobacteriota bacterium]|nr:ABC transporter permease [Acidobacteriota bacterium]
MRDFWIDLRFAIRLLAKNPAFTAVALLALAFGIGANTAIFSVVDGVLLDPLPFPDSQRLYRVWELESQERSQVSFTHPDFRELKRQSRSWDPLAAYQFDNFNLTGGQQPEQLRAAKVSADLFSLLRVPALEGRTIDARDQEGRGSQVTVLSHRLWQRQYGGRPIIGDTIELDGKPFEVVGVMPPGFSFPYETPWDLFIPLGTPAESQLEQRNLFVLGRLAPAVQLSRAEEEMRILAQRLAQTRPPDEQDVSIGLVSMHEHIVGDLSLTLWLLMAAVGLVLLIACTNIATLLLARSREREKEIGVRLAIGAGRGRIVRQMLTESVLLAVLGGGLGVTAAFWALDALLALAPSTLPRLDEVTIDPGVLLFSLAVTLATGLIFGLLPALQGSRADLHDALSSASRGAAGTRGRRRWRNALVAAQVALAVVLLTGAGLVMRSLSQLSNVDPGFRTDILALGLVLPPNEYRSTQKISYFEQARENLSALPGVASAAAANFPPTRGQGIPSLVLRPAQSRDEEGQTLSQRVVTEGYFRTLGIGLLAGRAFRSSDDSGAPAVAVLNREAAQRLFPEAPAFRPRSAEVGQGDPGRGEVPGSSAGDQSAPASASARQVSRATGQRAGGAGTSQVVGAQIRMRGFDGRYTPLQVVGVVENTRPLGLESSAQPEIYLAYRQNAWSYMNILVRPTSGDPLALASSVRSALWEIDAQRPFFGVSSLAGSIDLISVATPRFRAWLLGSFSAVATLLAIIGLYGVISYWVGSRRRELGTRMALGAASTDILSMVLRQGMATTLTGVAAGLLLALALARFIGSLLFQVSPFDPLTFLSVPLLLAGVAFAACYLPARRAARVDPALALRSE